MCASLALAAGERGLRELLEALDIDGNATVVPQHHLTAMKHHAVVSAQCLPDVVHGLAQVRRAGVRIELRPQRVNDSVAGQAPLRRQA
ncbi:hypothetical protein FQZ97_991020 [compost metagenome]